MMPLACFLAAMSGGFTCTAVTFRVETRQDVGTLACLIAAAIGFLLCAVLSTQL